MSYLAKLGAIVARWVPCGNPDLIQLLDFDACEAILDSELEALAVQIDSVTEENTDATNTVEPAAVTEQFIEPIVEPVISSMPFIPAGEHKPLPVSVWGSPLPNPNAVSADDVCVTDDTNDISTTGDSAAEHSKSTHSNPTQGKGNKAKARRALARAEQEDRLLQRGDDHGERPGNRNKKKTLKALARQAGVKRLDINDLMIRSVEIRDV